MKIGFKKKAAPEAEAEEPREMKVALGEHPNNETTIRSNSDDYNRGTAMKQLIHEQYNSAYNHPVILKRYEEGRARDLNDEPKVDKTPVFVIGSGPSLDESIKHLREWKGGIICSTSHALTLMYYGIEPTHILALDPFSTYAEIEGVDWSRTRTKLIAHPGVWPDLIAQWPNDILCYRQNLGRPDSYYATTQRNMYTRRSGTRDLAEFELLIRTEVTLFACSPPAQMFVADRLGYGKVFLAGVDFAFPFGKERFTDYTVKTPGRTIVSGNAPDVEIPAEWERHEHPLGDDDPKVVMKQDQKLVKSVNGLPTRGLHLFYKKNTISAWRLSRQDMWTTDHGAMVEVPFVPIEKVIATQGKKPTARSEDWIKKQTERYLASVGAWVVEDEQGGVNFIEAPDPERELYEFMLKMSRQYACRNCGVTAVAEDAADHEGEECMQCHAKPGLTHSVRIDIEKNMRRVRELIAYVAAHPVPAH